MNAKPQSFILRLWPHHQGCRYEVRLVQSEQSQSFDDLEDLLHYLRNLLPAGSLREEVKEVEDEPH